MTVRTQKSRKPTWIILGGLLALAVALFLTRDPGPVQETTASTTTLPTSSTIDEATYGDLPPTIQAAVAEPTVCAGAIPGEFPQLQFAAPEDQQVEGPLTAVVSTSCGDITIELDPSTSPQSVNSFVFLAREGFFNGQVIHRVVTDFVFQTGDPTATGAGGPGYTIQDEFPPVGTPYPVGTVAMAKSGQPNSTGSQFFVVLADSPHLGSGDGLMFNVLGKVVEGLDVLELINSLEASSSDSGGSLYLEQVQILP